MPILRKKEIETDVLTLALNRIRRLYDLFDTVSVSFSGGKDSTAVLNLCEKVAEERGKLPLHVFHFDEEAIPFQVEDYVRRVANRESISLDWYCVPIKHRNASSATHPYWVTWAEEDEDKWVRPMPSEAIRSIEGYDHKHPKSIPEISGLLYPPHKYGRVVMVMGIRAQESLSRYRSVASREEDNYIVKGGSGFSSDDTVMHYGNTFKAYPIYDWATEDVWTAPKVFGWDYCECYDIWEMAGVPQNQQRLAPPYGEQPVKQLGVYKECFPELWAKMHNRVPGANTASLYSMTEIYGFGDKEKFDTVEEYKTAIAEKLKTYPQDISMALAKRIKSEIDAHYKKSKGQEILPNVFHPASGLSWSFLLYIAETMDTKNRRQPGMKVIPIDDPRHHQQLEKYNKALAECNKAK